MTDTRAMTTGEAEAWRAGFMEASRVVESVKFTEYRFGGKPSLFGLFAARSAVDAVRRALARSLKAMEPPA